MRSLPKKIFAIFLGTICLILLAYYVYVESRNFLNGPSIIIQYPINQSVVFGNEVSIRGIAERVTSITLNDSPIFVDQNGSFNEKLILQNGYNIMKFEASDRFGKRTEKILEFVVTSTPIIN